MLYALNRGVQRLLALGMTISILSGCSGSAVIAVHDDVNAASQVVQGGSNTPQAHDLFITAGRANAPKVIQLLLDNGADLWQTESVYGFSSMGPLGYGAFASLLQPDDPSSPRYKIAARYEDLVKVLLDAAKKQGRLKEFVNRPLDDSGTTVLHLLAMQPDKDSTLELLINAGANPNAVSHSERFNDGGGTPLHFAAKRLNTKAYKMLIAAGANTKLLDTQGATAASALSTMQKKASEPGFQWGKFAIAAVGVGVGAANGVDASTSANMLTGAVSDSMAGQSGFSNMQSGVQPNSTAPSARGAAAQQPLRTYTFNYTCPGTSDQRSTTWQYRTESCNNARKAYAQRAMCNDMDGLGAPPSCD